MDMEGGGIINKRPDKQGWVNRLLTGNEESQTHTRTHTNTHNLTYGVSLFMHHAGQVLHNLINVQHVSLQKQNKCCSSEVSQANIIVI